MPTQNAPAGIDGGRAALAGFLYQILGTAGIVCSRADEVSSGDEHADAVLIAEPETQGQDLILTQLGLTDKCSRHVIQFKYSSRPDDYPVRPGEFIGIIEAMRKADQATDSANPGFVLVTNRPIAPQLQAIIGELGGPGPFTKFNRVNNQVAGSGREKTRRKLIASSLKIVCEGWGDWRNALRNAANAYGVLPVEFEAAVATVVGKLTEASVDPARKLVTGPMLFEWLLGFPNPRRITRSNLATVMNEDLENFRLEIDCDLTLIRREVLESLAANRDRALVVLLGSGGCGKSATAYQALSSLVDGAEPVAYVSATGMAGLSRDWVSQLVRRWRNVRPGGAIDAARPSLERLAIAHGNLNRPVIAVVVDGVDEAITLGGDQLAHIRELLFMVRDIAREENGGAGPLVTLLITCRDEEELDQAWGFRRLFREEEREVLRVDDFSPNELATFISQKVGGDMARRVRRSSGLGSRGLDGGDLGAEETLADEQARDIASGVLDSLRHPLLAKLFTLLIPARRDGFIYGEPQARRELGARYIEWFLEKLRRRNLGVPTAEARGILAAVAGISNAMVPYRFAADWVVPACAGGRFPEGMATQVFRESVSFGLAGC